MNLRKVLQTLGTQVRNTRNYSGAKNEHPSWRVPEGRWHFPFRGDNPLRLTLGFIIGAVTATSIPYLGFRWQIIKQS